jgi:hypothetical protein
VPWHVLVTLPDGRTAAADHREPITSAMRAIQAARHAGRDPDPLDLRAVAAWLDTHAGESEACRAGRCGHG